MSIKGPYVDAVFFNKPGETIYLCVDCANDRGVPEENSIMYDDAPRVNRIECHDCGAVCRSQQ